MMSDAVAEMEATGSFWCPGDRACVVQRAGTSIILLQSSIFFLKDPKQSLQHYSQISLDVHKTRRTRTSWYTDQPFRTNRSVLESDQGRVFRGHATVTASEMPQTVVLKKTDCDSRKSDKSSPFSKQEIRWTWVPAPRPRAQIHCMCWFFVLLRRGRLICAVSFIIIISFFFFCGPEYLNLF